MLLLLLFSALSFFIIIIDNIRKKIKMKKRCILKEMRWKKNPLVEFHLVKLPNFYTELNIFTSFPDCQRFVQEQKEGGQKSNVYLLSTFQPNDGYLVPISTESELDEKIGVEKSLQASKVSALISYSPASSEWKDNSRAIFCDFLDNLCTALENKFSCRNMAEDYRISLTDSSFSKNLTPGKSFFIDAIDPASSVPIISHRGPSTFSESSAMEEFYNLETVLIPTSSGGCRMVSHPKYGLNVYPSSIAIAIPDIEEGPLLSAIKSLSVEDEEKNL